MVINRILLVGICCICVLIIFTQVYKWVDKDDRVQLSDRPPASEQTITQTPNKTRVADKHVNGVSETPSVQLAKRDKNSNGVAYPESTILKIRWLLQQNKFDELNLTLEGYQTESESNISAEELLFTAYNAFDIEDKSYVSKFNAWVEATPGSYQPYLARAKYFYRLGWASRGGKWASETKKEQFDEMNAYFNRAMKDIAVTLKINKQPMVAYDMQVGIAIAQDMDNEAAKATKKALEINPASYQIRAHYLRALTPRWGGSFEQMQEFIAGSLVHVSKNPKLKLLEGFTFAEAGDMQATVKMYSSADELYTKALTYGENHRTLKERGDNSYRRENYKDALKDLNRAIDLYPEAGEYYYWRSKTYSKLEKFDNALNDIERAIQLDSDDKYIQRQREWLISKFTNLGYELQNNRKLKAAIEQYDSALRLDPKDASLYYRRARAFVDLNQHDLALSDLKRAIKLDPNYFGSYQLLDWILAKRKDWDQIITYWDQYIALNPDNGRAYVERGGAYYHKGDMKSAVSNAKIAADMGNLEGKEAYEKFRHRIK